MTWTWKVRIQYAWKWLTGRTQAQRSRQAVAARQWQEARADLRNTVGEGRSAVATVGGAITRVVFGLLLAVAIVGCVAVVIT